MGLKKRILVVEDDPSLRALLEITLAMEYTVFSAHDGQAALSCMEKEKPDLLLMDVMIPVMDGKAVCEAIRQSDKYGKPKIIIVTGSIDSDTVQETWKSRYQVDGFFAKPYELTAVKDAIHRLLAD